MLLYAFLPAMALLVRFNPWLGTAILIAIGLGWRAWVAFDGDWLRDFYFGDNQFNLGIESLFIARQFFGAVAIFALGILARWLVVHGHLDWFYRVAGPAGRQLVPGTDAAQHRAALLGRGRHRRTPTACCSPSTTLP